MSKKIGGRERPPLSTTLFQTNASGKNRYLVASAGSSLPDLNASYR